MAATCAQARTCLCRCAVYDPDLSLGILRRVTGGCAAGDHCEVHGRGCHMGEVPDDGRRGPGSRHGRGGFRRGENPAVLRKRRNRGEKNGEGK